MMWEIFWMYLGLFVTAAIPWFEVIVVVPAGIALGLNPVAVAFIAFLGNALTVLVIIVFFDWLGHRQWFRRFFRMVGSQSEEEESDRRRKKRERATRLFQKYGVPGLALLGPVIIGSHFAAALALALQGGKNVVGGWMLISLSLWTIIMTIAAVAGFQWIPSYTL